jgi:small subunit ribosomal protein S1
VVCLENFRIKLEIAQFYSSITFLSNMAPKSSPSNQSSFSMDDFALALSRYDYQFEKGQVVKGKVVQHSSDGAYVDIGGKSSALLPLYEAGLSVEAPIEEILPLGTEIEFLIVKEQDADGQVTLSRRQLLLKEAWEDVSQISDTKKPVQVRITGVNKGGVTAEFNGLNAFIPRSHLIEKNDLDSLVGQTLTANFIEVDQDKNKLVLSQREIAKAAMMDQLVVGNLVTGTVAKVQPYGYFVDCGGVSGLLHIKQISGGTIENLNSLFRVGQQIKVAIVEIDEYRNRFSLSTKVLEAFPGELLQNMAAVMDNAEERLEQYKANFANAQQN